MTRTAPSYRVWTATEQFEYFYDYADRLVEVVDMAGGLPEQVATYTYDALGRRITKTAPGLGVDVDYVHDGVRVIEERDAFGVSDKTFVLGGTPSQDDGVIRDFNWTQAGGPFKFSSQTANLLMTSGGQDFQYHFDDLGNTLALTDSGGNIVERYEYDDYGTPQFLSAQGVPTGTNASLVGNPYLFRAMYWDAETTLFHDNRRDGDPVIEWAFEKGWPSHYEGPRSGSGSGYMDSQAGRYLTRDTGNNKNWSFVGGGALTFAGDNPWSPRDAASGLATGKRLHRPASHPGLHAATHCNHGIVHRDIATRNVLVAPQGGFAPAKENRDQIKTYFETGDVPSQAQFGNLIDSGLARHTTVYVLKKEEGGRHTPFHNKYRPQFLAVGVGGMSPGNLGGGFGSVAHTKPREAANRAKELWKATQQAHRDVLDDGPSGGTPGGGGSGGGSSGTGAGVVTNPYVNAVLEAIKAGFNLTKSPGKIGP